MAQADVVVVTRPVMGLLYMQVCAHKNASHEAVESEANRLNPAGTSNGWSLMVEGFPHEPAENQRPVPCEDYPNRIHYLLVC